MYSSNYEDIDKYWENKTIIDSYLLRQIFGNKEIDNYINNLDRNKYIVLYEFIIKDINNKITFNNIHYASNNTYYWKRFIIENYKDSFIGGSFAVYKNKFTMMPSGLVEIFSNSKSTEKMRDNDMLIKIYKYPFELKFEKEIKIHQAANILHTVNILGYKKDYSVRALKMFREKYNIDLEDIRYIYNITKDYYIKDVYKWANY